jgi:hypothetical protein
MLLMVSFIANTEVENKKNLKSEANCADSKSNGPQGPQE